MPQTLSGVLRRTAVEPEAPTALEALAALDLQIMQPPVELSCENPECRNTCAWKRTKGRPQIFCSRECKQRYESTRGRMLAEIATLETILARPGRATAVQQNRLRAELAHRRWVGRHYGIYQEGPQH